MKTLLKHLQPKSEPWYYIAVVCISLIFNWFVQFFYYLYMVHVNPSAFVGEKTLIDYRTGYIGDLVLLPLMNVAILYVFIRSRSLMTRRSFIYVGIAGLVADITLHFFQGYLRLTNWSMPRPFAWDFVSYWHMVSFFFQISFVFLFFYLVFRRAYRQSAEVSKATYGVFMIIFSFVFLFLYDYVPSSELTTKVAALRHLFIR